MQRQHARSLKHPFLALLIAGMLALVGAPAQGADIPAATPLEQAPEDPDKPRAGKTPAATDAQPAEAGAKPSQAKDPAREVVVTATRTEREVFDVPSSVSVVTKQEMEREPQSTIAQHLQDIPGVEVSDGGMGGGAKRIKIRGEAPSRVLVLIDGMKISEQKSMDGSMIMIDPLNVERIEVIKGPASVLYGSEAIGGVINIITKKGGTKPVQGGFAFTMDGSDDSLTPYGTLYGSYKGFSYRIAGDYTDAGDKRGGSGTIADTSYLQTNASAYLDYSWGSGKIGGGYDRFWSNINIPGAESDGVDVELDLPRWQRDRFYAFTEVEQISDVLQKVRLTGYMQETKKDFWNDITVNQRVTMGPTRYMLLDVWQHPYTKNDQKSYGGNLQTDWTFDENHYVILGVDYLYDDLDASDSRQGRTSTQMFVMGMPLPPSITTSEALYNYDAHQQTMAVFAQDEWTFHPDWTATIGLRQTWIQSALDNTDDPTLSESATDDSHLVGSLGLVYSGLRDWRFRAQYAQGYRFPLLNQMYIGTTHGSSGRTYPNPDLKPETSQNFEVGARYDGIVTADLALYYNWAEDYITNRKLPAPNPNSDSRFENVNEAHTYGAELTLSWTYDPWGLTPYAAGAYMHRTFDYGDAGIGKTSDTGNPAWTGRVGLKWERELTPVLTMYTDVYGRFACRAKEDLSDGSTENHPGWGTANFTVGARLGEEQNYFVDLNVNNIFDHRYTPASSSLEDPGTYAVLRVGMEF